MASPAQGYLRISTINTISLPYSDITDSNSYTKVYLDNTVPQFTTTINNYRVNDNISVQYDRPSNNSLVNIKVTESSAPVGLGIVYTSAADTEFLNPNMNTLGKIKEINTSSVPPTLTYINWNSAIPGDVVNISGTNTDGSYSNVTGIINLKYSRALQPSPAPSPSPIPAAVISFSNITFTARNAASLSPAYITLLNITDNDYRVGDNVNIVFDRGTGTFNNIADILFINNGALKVDTNPYTIVDVRDITLTPSIGTNVIVHTIKIATNATAIRGTPTGRIELVSRARPALRPAPSPSPAPKPSPAPAPGLSPIRRILKTNLFLANPVLPTRTATVPTPALPTSGPLKTLYDKYQDRNFLFPNNAYRIYYDNGQPRTPFLNGATTPLNASNIRNLFILINNVQHYLLLTGSDIILPSRDSTSDNFLYSNNLNDPNLKVTLRYNTSVPLVLNTDNITLSFVPANEISPDPTKLKTIQDGTTSIPTLMGGKKTKKTKTKKLKRKN